jgi:hypothetical protein
VNHEECRRILGVPAEAPPEIIRQAYLDLARVWHPDRFQSDERLRKIAEDHLREVNEAYAILKNYRPPQSRPGPRPAQAAPAPDPPPARPDPVQAPPWTPPPVPRRRRSLALVPQSFSYNFGYTAMAAVVLVLPFLAVSRLVSLVRIPTLDTNPLSTQALQPNILSPMRLIDPHSDVLAAADALTYWARGDGIDLWKPAGYRGPDAPAAVPSVNGDGLKPPVHAPMRGNVRRPAAAAAHEPPPPNGADLIATGRQSGAGELHLSNHTGLEAVFKLVSDRRTRRAVYVVPNGSVTLRAIPVGVYDLHVDLGKDLDVERIVFLNERKTPTPLGPFQFQQITSDTGISGNHYEVVLNAQ